MMRPIAISMLITIGGGAMANECSGVATEAAKYAVQNHEAARNPDHFGEVDMVYHRALKTIVWLNARYYDGHDQTRWCVSMALSPKCRTAYGLLDDPGKIRIVDIRECPVMPFDDDLGRLLRAIHWQ